MNYVIARNKIYKTKIVELAKLKFIANKLALKILRELAKKPACALDVARALKLHEQKVYYYFRKMEKAGIIKKVKEEKRIGVYAKIYELQAPFVSSKIVEKSMGKAKLKLKEMEVLYPFIANNKMNSIVVVGSPDPHGRFGYQASDGYAAIDLALFLGSFIEKPTLNYKLDTQISLEDVKNNNLILIGGPKANIWVDKINKKLPIFLDEKKEWRIISKKTGKVYTEDEIGILIKMKNPFNPKKYVLILTGRRFKGTRAAVVALVKKCKKLEGQEFARVVKGIDRDADGIIDDAEFLE